MKNMKQTGPLTLSEKILQSHCFQTGDSLPRRGEYADFRPDRVAMQDATAQMAVLQFLNAHKEKTAVPTSIHCDHLIRAYRGAEADLEEALKENKEGYDFLQSSAWCYGMDFWKPGAGIIHQIVFENYAFPGGLMVGTDSHTPNAGGLGMIAIGVGGADAVDVMTGMEWELKVPKIIGVRLTGKLGGWASPKDVILKLTGMLTVKGGTNSIIEYFGPGCETISCTGKATICNMGAEVGATCSIFPFDSTMYRYLCATGRERVAEQAMSNTSSLRADDEVYANPERYYDKVIEINLSEIEPYVNGPFTPDAACPLSEMPRRVREMGYPEAVEVALVGSCTNSSYQDLARAAAVAQAAMDMGLTPKARLIIIPGSERIKVTAEKDGIIAVLRRAGALIMTNACGPCIGQWKRVTDDNNRRNSIVTTFNRNFAKRADGNPNTFAFIVSPEIAVAFAFSGVFGIPEGLEAPTVPSLPLEGFAYCDSGCSALKETFTEPLINLSSSRIQRLKPFERWDGSDFMALPLLIKTKGKCTTDHISMAGPWLQYRGHLENISGNFLLGAVDAFTGESGVLVEYPGAPGKISAVSARARRLGTSIVVAEDNYGEGSSREHAAMEARYLGVKVIIAKSYARIHETNLKKQGVLALTFADSSDYDKVLSGDMIDVMCSSIAPGVEVQVMLNHKDGSTDRIVVNHTYNDQQIGWFKTGSALNCLCKK